MKGNSVRFKICVELNQDEISWNWVTKETLYTST